MRKNPFLMSIAAVALLSACSSDDGNDTLTGPDSAACTVNSISGGTTRTGVVAITDCKFDSDWFGDSLYYDSYAVRLEAGKAYVFYLKNVNEAAQAEVDDFDTGLTLVDANGVIAVSDDEGGGPVNGHNSQLAFVAPTSGVYSIRAHGYSESDTGSYSLREQDCGAAPTLTNDITNGSIAAGDCIVHNLWDDFDEGDSSRVDFYKLTLSAGQEVTIRVQSAAFDPFVSISGPGFDAQANLDGDYDYNWGTSPVTATYTASTAGVYTIMVAPSPDTELFGTTGAYTIDIEPNPAAAARTAPSLRVTKRVKDAKK